VRQIHDNAAILYDSLGNELTREILEEAIGGASGSRVLGGTLLEWADEWWKDDAGSPSTDEIGGIGPGWRPLPECVFNEEWGSSTSTGLTAAPSTPTGRISANIGALSGLPDIGTGWACAPSR
jgi:hypothetical protein